MGTLLWIVTHRKKLIKAICGLFVALLLAWGITLSCENKKLSESLEMAQNNIEAYQGSLAGSQQANNVLQLHIDELQQYNDKLVHNLDSVREKLKIKPKHVKTAATQTQSINVIGSKEIEKDIITILKDTTYSDSIKFNDLTMVSYTIGKDTVSIGLDINNTQYLYVYTDKHYKNKKSFLKRLFTLDFKKVTSTKYIIENTNDIIKTDSVRVVEVTTK